MPTLPAFTRRLPADPPVELDVRVPADDHALRDSLHGRRHALAPVRSASGSPRRSAASRGRRGRGRARPRPQIACPAAPRATRAGRRSSCSADQRVRSSHRSGARRAAPRSHGRRSRAGSAARSPNAEQPFEPRAGASARWRCRLRRTTASTLERIHLRQHSLEGRQVAVHVVEGRDLHSGAADGRGRSCFQIRSPLARRKAADRSGSAGRPLISNATASASVAANESAISDPRQPWPQAEPNRRAEEEGEEEDVRQPQLGGVVLAGDREGDRERVEDLRLLLDDHLGRPLEDRVRVHGNDQDRRRAAPSSPTRRTRETTSRARSPPRTSTKLAAMSRSRELEEDGQEDERDDRRRRAPRSRRPAGAGARAT